MSGPEARDREQYIEELIALVRGSWDDGVLPLVILTAEDGSTVGFVSPFDKSSDLLRVLNTCRKQVLSGRHDRDRRIIA